LKRVQCGQNLPTLFLMGKTIRFISNIAEGTSRKSNKDKSHFSNIAYGSLMELVCQMEMPLEIGYIIV